MLIDDVVRQQMLDLAGMIQVMKPNKVAEDNTKQLIRLDSLLDSPDYAAEEKIDGCHYTTIGCIIVSTEKVEKTNNFPHFKKFFEELGMFNMILDGEIHYPGKTSQYCTRVTGAGPDTALDFQRANGFIHYTLFDMLRTPKGTWLIQEPYKNRRKILEYFYNSYIANTPMAEFIHLSEISYDNKRQFKDDILSAGKEGVVLKKLNSLYAMGKKPMWQWMKIKQADEADFIITGFDEPKKEYQGKNMENWPYWEGEGDYAVPVTKYYYNNWIGAVQLSAYVDGELTQITTASGMDEELRAHMSANKELYINRVAKVGYMEKTEKGIPRHPKLVSLHEGKRPEECTWQFNN